MRADLIGHLPVSPDKLTMWRNVFGSDANTTGSFRLEDAPLYGDKGMLASSSCKLANPHSSAFIDLNGDCLADLFLVCEDSGWLGSSQSYQIWTANRDAKKPGYTLARQGKLPAGTGALSFADMDRDGTIDVVFPSCDSNQCYVNIAYNRQMPLCSEKRNDWFGVGPGGALTSNQTANCRDTESNLCTADDSFSFDFDVNPKNDKLTRLPIADVTPELQLLMTDELSSPKQPVSLALGDFNRDGYPDLALITIPRRGRRDETRLRLLESISCDVKGTPRAGCPADPALRSTHRTFKMHTDGTEAIDVLTDARAVSFFDLDEDGSLDMLVQRLPSPDMRADSSTNRRRVTFVQNNYFYDAFFLKAMTSNGACSSYCDTRGPNGERYRPWGVNYNGASYKFTVLDTSGIRRPQQVGQLAQTAYRSLLLPYAYFGLGRTNNYVESLFVGVTRRRTNNFVELEGVIPNSQVVILPWEPEDKDANRRGDTSTWHRELYLSPGEWIPWVTVVLATIVVMLLGVVFVLHLHERREDERERKRAVHAINFDAL
jgi:integrin alpha FG-GAP repeat containing protein 1